MHPQPALKPMSGPNIGVWLVTLGFITKRQLLTAMEAAKEQNQTLDVVLLQQHTVGDEEMAGAVALRDDLAKSAQLRDLNLEESLLSLVPRGFALREQVLPLRLCGSRLVVAYAQGYNRGGPDQRVLDQLGTLTGKLVHGIGFNAEELNAAVHQCYDPRATRGVIERAIQKATPQATAAAKKIIEVADETRVEAPVVELVNRILAQAVERRASDIHIRPTAKGLSVKMRLDGVMQPLMELPAELGSPVMSRLKIMADMNIAERRRPQDGRASIMVGGKPFDLRVAAINTHWGEMAVLRILRPLAISNGYNDLGLTGHALERWQRITKAPNGLILVTGPTGSGKTSTLYTTLAQFDRTEKNILTVEDPVEYPVPGLAQIQAVPSIGLTFAAALRTLLRLDPDVILVGEIRDHETLEVALEAAQTGHLVLSTMHTNDAVAAVGRMIEMGAPRHQVAATLVGVLAQRLVRLTCHHCETPYAPTPEDRKFFELAPDDELPAMKYGVGCDLCDGIGFKGRVGIYEVLEVNAPFADAISQGASPHALWRSAMDGGMTSLMEDGRAKVIANRTTIKEVHRVVGLRGHGE